MKNTNIKILMCALVILVSSCADSLDKDPITSFSARGFYKNASDAQAGVYGIYNSMQSAFRQNFALWGEGRADAVATNQSGDPSVLIQNNLSPVIPSSRWDNLYTVISRANYAIKYIPTVFESEGTLQNQLMGQARALRAISYFYAVRVWGNVPLIVEPFESIQQNVFSGQTDPELVLDQIEDDLKYASTHCADSYTGARNRVIITRGAADAFLTQVYMWRRKYDDAIDAAQRVLDNPTYSLVSIQDWNKIFSDGVSNESIFEIGYNEIQTNALRVIYALGSDSFYFPSLKFRSSFENGDLRRTKIYDVTQGDTPRKIWKFFGEGFNDESPDPSSNNIVMVRLADIILLKAEAHAHLEQPDLALPLLNQIRRRAGLTNLDLAEANSTYGDLVSTVLHERSIELCYEGHRWFDLVRNGKAIAVMGPINGISDPRNLLWPIHEDITNRNPSLDQSEFYR